MRNLPTAAIVGCIAGIICWGVWTATSMASSNQDMDYWIALIGAAYLSDRPVCSTDWQEFDGERKAKCERLRYAPGVARQAPVGAMVALGEKSDSIEFMKFSIDSFVAPIENVSDGSRRLTDWPEMVADNVDPELCVSHDMAIEGARWWECGDVVIAHTGLVPNGGVGAEARLWIGHDSKKLRASVQRRGKQEHLLRVSRHISSANDYLAADHKAAAHREMSAAYTLLDVLAADQINPDVQRLHGKLQKNLTRLADDAARQRQAYATPAPLPTLSGSIYLPVLHDRTSQDIDYLLGPAVKCSDDDQKCSYGDDHWTIEIVFEDERSELVSISK